MLKSTEKKIAAFLSAVAGFLLGILGISTMGRAQTQENVTVPQGSQPTVTSDVKAKPVAPFVSPRPTSTNEWIGHRDFEAVDNSKIALSPELEKILTASEEREQFLSWLQKNVIGHATIQELILFRTENILERLKAVESKQCK